MKLELFINFDGNCREAVEFYAKVFKTEAPEIMTYGEAPPDPNYTPSEADRDRICYAGIQAGDMVLMFMDMPADAPLTVGDNITPTISMDDKAEVTRLFNELKEGGEVLAELQETFYSKWYGMVKDKFGIIWHTMHYAQA